MKELRVLKGHKKEVCCTSELLWARERTIAYHAICLPSSWPVFQNDDFLPNNTFSVWSHVMKYVSLGTTRLNDIDPLSIC